MNRFWDAMNKSIVVSSILALCVLLTICYLAIAQLEIPEVLILGFGTILGFFFGSRSGQQAERIQVANEALRVPALQAPAKEDEVCCEEARCER